MTQQKRTFTIAYVGATKPMPPNVAESFMQLAAIVEKRLEAEQAQQQSDDRQQP